MPSYSAEANLRAERPLFDTDPAKIFSDSKTPADRMSFFGVEIVSRTCGTTSGSATVTCTDTSQIEIGMICTGTGVSGGISCTTQVAGNTFTKASHGIPDGTPIVVTAMATSAGVTLNRRYYVVGTATNTFQVAATRGGAAVDLTGSDGTATVKINNSVTAITTDTSVVLDVPALSTQASTVLCFRGNPLPVVE